MHVINATNVNEAYVEGLDYLRNHGCTEVTRAGRVLVAPGPVTTVYEQPQQRVLLDPTRDANPFFHLFESLWMLVGWRDARWLDRFVGDFSERFAEADGNQHGAYGQRWREHFQDWADDCPMDQLDAVVNLLKRNPSERRAVISMWDPQWDLGQDKKDLPCNTHAYLRVRGTEYDPDAARSGHAVLDLTVCCRSNDIIWGAYGANAVHFSVLQEYLAARLGVAVGRYYQVSNNFHAYEDVFERVAGAQSTTSYYPGTVAMVADPVCWDGDLQRFMDWTQRAEPDEEPQVYLGNPWLHETAEPMFIAHMLWKRGDREHALEIVRDEDTWPYWAPDWRQAAQEWMERRMK